MFLRCELFQNFEKYIKNNNKSIVMFGAGAIGQISVPEILKTYGLFDRIDSYLDNNKTKWGKFIETCGKKFEIKSPEYLNKCDEHTVILLNISRFADAINQLEMMDSTRNMECYIMPMMMIHNYCREKSLGYPEMSKDALIPKKLHYMWLGRKEIPDKLKRCMDSWRKQCPDYDIIEWNEDNYDIEKHPYMKQAYKAKAYGFVPDYARLDILYNEGGFYLDTDVELRRNLDELRNQHAFCGVEKWQIINFGGLSGSIKGHPMVKAFLNARDQISFYNEDGSLNKNTCGFYDTRVAINYGYRITGATQCINGMNIYASDYFHPFDYMSGIINETENTYSIHWFNGGWLDEKMKRANEESKKQYLKLYDNALKTVKY